MQNIRLIMLVCIHMVSTIYGMTINFENTEMYYVLKETIEERSLPNFLLFHSNLQHLNHDDICKLRGVCSAYASALKVIRELREIPEIEVERRKIITGDDNESCLQWFYNHFPTHARSRAIDLNRQTVGTPLGRVLEDITPEYKRLPNTELYKKIERERNSLNAIQAILTAYIKE